MLSNTDVSHNLAVPSDFLRDLGGEGGDKLTVMDNHTRNVYEFVLSTRAGPYKKPVFKSNGWIRFVKDKQLQVGQTIYFWKNDDEDFFRVQVLLKLLE